MSSEKKEIIIIGSGLGAICAAIKLREIGIHDFVMLEKEDEFGGTWYLNTYPGAQVDVHSYLYSFSFEPYNWSRVFAMQEEILAYTNHLLDKYDLRKNGRLQEEVVLAAFDDNDHIWKVQTGRGHHYQGKVLINATGVLNTPSIPELPGASSFEGATFHSSQWDHTFDHCGKKVAVIGTGASAIQVIPTIANDVAELNIFQRTPHWVMPRPDRSFRKWERNLLSKSKFARWMYREFLFWTNEARIIPFTKMPAIMKIPRLMALHHIRKHIKDPKLREKLTPNFMIGCKRILLSNEYYPTLLQSNVNFETEGIQEITADGIITNEKKHLELDAIVYCTGFKAADFFPYQLIGRKGIDIHDSWSNGGHAYKGTTIPGFPNFFMLAGPNTGIGHTSALHIAESQINYIISGIQKMKQHHWKLFDVKAAIEDKYNRKLHLDMKRTVWQSGGCQSWYQNAEGKNTTLNPYSNVTFRRATKEFREEEYEVEV